MRKRCDKGSEFQCEGAHTGLEVGPDDQELRGSLTPHQEQPILLPRRPAAILDDGVEVFNIVLNLNLKLSEEEKTNLATYGPSFGRIG